MKTFVSKVSATSQDRITSCFAKKERKIIAFLLTKLFGYN